MDEIIFDKNQSEIQLQYSCHQWKLFLLIWTYVNAVPSNDCAKNNVFSRIRSFDLWRYHRFGYENDKEENRRRQIYSSLCREKLNRKLYVIDKKKKEFFVLDSVEFYKLENNFRYFFFITMWICIYKIFFNFVLVECFAYDAFQNKEGLHLIYQ